MDKNIRIAQYMDQRMVSPVEENFMTIDGATYATGKDGQGLYRLIPEEQARFFVAFLRNRKMRAIANPHMTRVTPRRVPLIAELIIRLMRSIESSLLTPGLPG